MYISMKFGTGVHVFCWEVGVFNRSCFRSVSCNYHISLKNTMERNTCDLHTWMIINMKNHHASMRTCVFHDKWNSVFISRFSDFVLLKLRKSEIFPDLISRSTFLASRDECPGS